MTVALSERLQTVLDALPLRPGLRVLDVGCGLGALARAMSKRVAPGGHVLGLDRSARAIEQALSGSAADVAAGLLSFRLVAAEDFALEAGEAPFDLIVAVRVGALDGRHPEVGDRAWPRLRAALAPGGRVFVDGVERPPNERTGRVTKPQHAGTHDQPILNTSQQRRRS